MNVHTEIAQRLQDMRKLKGWSIEEAASRTGIDVNSLLDIENGVREASASDLKAISKVYGYSVDKIIFNEDIDYYGNTNIMNILLELSDKQMLFILSIVEILLEQSGKNRF